PAFDVQAALQTDRPPYKTGCPAGRFRSAIHRFAARRNYAVEFPTIRALAPANAASALSLPTWRALARPDRSRAESFRPHRPGFLRLRRPHWKQGTHSREYLQNAAPCRQIKKCLLLLRSQ